MASQTYDFIIVGGGAAGSALTSRLANSKNAPSVLLLEAGGPNADPEFLVDSERYTAFMSFPSLNWSYNSVPQSHLSENLTINCSRGKGLGGSTAINFCAWVLGDAEDYNHWADLVGDDCWKWDGKDGKGGVKERFRKIENLHLEGADESVAVKGGFLDIESLKQHSQKGMIDLTYSKNCHSTQVLSLEAAKEFGMPINGDINSGNGLGMGTGAASFYKGSRITASIAYLRNVPPNLTIKTDTPVAKVLFDSSSDKPPKAIGVQTISGEKFYANREVVICGGTIDSPKLLLLSGIGPQEDLSTLSIPITCSSSYVGANLQDHNPILTSLLLKGTKDPGNLIYNSSPMAFISSPSIKSSSEFLALSPQTKSHLEKVASYEIISSHRNAMLPPHLQAGLSEDARVMIFHTVLMNEQSRGSVKLSSSNPLSPPLIDNQTLTHPYDRRVAIEGLRETLQYIRTPAIAKETARILAAATDESDEGLFEYWKQGVSSTWHFTGTCKMGRDNDEEAVVDTEFRVRGVKGLRVCDMSVAPLVPNNHVQSTAFLIGETLAEKMIGEYELA